MADGKVQVFKLTDRVRSMEEPHAVEFAMGRPYFFLRFAGTGATAVPVVESLIYIGKDLDPGPSPEARWFFQDPDSYFLHGAYQRDAEERVVAEDEYEGAGEPSMEIHTFAIDVARDLLTLEQLVEALAARYRTS